MIRSFRNHETEQLFRSGQSRAFQACERQAFQKLRMLDASSRLSDLGVLPGNRLEALKGDRKGQYSIRINGQFRICFEWRDGDTYEVEVTDYH
ncbi:MAG: type II toxin-antitoxin system RelE/ParE family toxin [Bryobacterales bacterium]|nr:type II toxin-antitoxin system RelE/ParE family toxin [Bryobacterales bacterium]